MSILSRYRGIFTDVAPTPGFTATQAEPAPAPVVPHKPMFSRSYGYSPVVARSSTPAFFSLGRLAELSKRFALHPIYKTISRSNAGLGDVPAAGNKELHITGYEI